MASRGKGRGGGRRRRVVLVPYPFQGHLTPMLQLGSILEEKGFAITVSHTSFNSPNPSNYPNLSFLPLSDKLEGLDSSFYNILNFMSVMNTNCEPSFQEQMEQMLDSGEDVACVIYDNIMRFVDVVATRLELASVVLRTASAAFMHSHIPLFQFAADKIIPLPESRMEDLVPNLHPLRFKDLPLPATREIPEVVEEFLESYMNVRSSAAVIWNTLEELDEWPLQQLRQQWRVPFFTIGPFHKMTPPLVTSLIEEEDALCLSWLHKQSPNSVIYVSLGSLATLEEKDFIQMAMGLARSGHPFLWVVRPDLLKGSDAIGSLPSDFESAAGERGLVVKWAPQRKVLEHPAVGGFLSHCGWNSTLESLCEGVPMICRPCFGDQLVNARYLCSVWKVGVEVEKSADVETAVREVMGGECGREMRERAVGIKLQIEASMKPGGSSSHSLQQLVDFVASL